MTKLLIKSLRANQTAAELRLWYHLRAHRFLGIKFKRQKPIGPYLVDFVCVEQRLVIEVDGGQHQDQANYDQQRDTWLRSQGYRVLRFWNNQVMFELPGVLERITGELEMPSPPTPLPFTGEGS